MGCWCRKQEPEVGDRVRLKQRSGTGKAEGIVFSVKTHPERKQYTVVVEKALGEWAWIRRDSHQDFSGHSIEVWIENP